MQKSVQIHLETVEMIRKKAASVSRKSAGDMVKKLSSKHPPAEYKVGSEVLAC